MSLILSVNIQSQENEDIVNIIEVTSNSVNLKISDQITQSVDIFIVLRPENEPSIMPLTKVKYSSTNNISIIDSSVITGVNNYIVYTSVSDKIKTIEGLHPDNYYIFDIYQKQKNEYKLLHEYRFTTLAEMPERQTQRIMWSDQGTNSFRIYAAGGTGKYSLITISKSQNDFVPINGQGYKADSSYGLGNETNEGINIVLSSNDTTKSVFVTNLESGTYYYITAFEFNGKDESSNYNKELIPKKNAIRLPTLLETPIILRLTSPENGSIKVDWKKVNGAKSYEIEVARDAHFQTPDEIYGNIDVGNIDSFLLFELAENAEYFVRVRATAETGASFFSNILSIKL